MCVDHTGLIIHLDTMKIRRLSSGAIMGMAGTPYDLDSVEDWFNASVPADFPKVEELFDLMVVEPDERVFVYSRRGTRTEVMPPHAIGSGMDLAIGAMLAGATPREAVNIVVNRHQSCGGVITELRIGEANG